MDEPKSPEEKLLRLIRRKNRQPAGKGEARPAIFLNGILNKVKQKKDRVINAAFIFLQRGLPIIVLILFGYALYEFAAARHDINTILKGASPASAAANPQETPAVDVKPYSYYQQEFNSRDIFESPINKKPEEPNPAPSIPELTKNLRLVGIVLDREGEAIIEDLEVKQVFFLRKGDRIRDATIDEIKESKVILTYHDQRVELTQ